MINWNKIVVFGAGKIGRSFIGQLFSRSGYEVVFIDVFKPVIDELNLKNQYKVIIKSETEETLLITNVRGVLAGDEDKVIDEVSSAGILAVSIGQKGLSAAKPPIAKGDRYSIRRSFKFRNFGSFNESKRFCRSVTFTSF